MTSNQKFFAGAKYGILAIVISLFVSPFLFYLMTFLREAMKHPDNIFRPIFIIWDIYIGASIFGFVFLFFPYLLGGGVLGLLIADKRTVSPGWFGMIVGLSSGLVGLLLMTFLIWRVESYRTIDWPAIGIVEMWSAIVFITIAYRLKSVRERFS